VAGKAGGVNTPRAVTVALHSISGLMILFLLLPLLGLANRAALADVGAIWAQDGAAIVDAVALSARTTALSVLLIFVFGTPLAYVLARAAWLARVAWLRRLLIALVELPMVLPPSVAGLALLLTFGRRGLVGPTLSLVGVQLPFSVWAVVLAQVFVAAPLYIRAAQVGFQAIDPQLEEAARVDGAGPWALFSRITLPLARRALTAGLLMSWARALGEFGATILFAGNLQSRTQTMPLLIYTIFERDLDAAAWTAALLLVLALGALLLAQRLAR
jgi:molybdate transport system permease protein